MRFEHVGRCLFVFRFALSVLAGLAVAAANVPAHAEVWPSKPVRMIVPYAPGGSVDAMARALANQLQNRFSQPFVVENRPGGSGIMGTDQVARAAPDGYTLLINSSSIASNGAVQKSDFDPLSNLTPIAMLASAPDVLLISGSLPVKTIPELVAHSKTNSAFYGSSGVGSTGHLHTELFNQRTGSSLKHVPYKGVANALQDLAGGRVQVVFGSIASAAGLINSGHVRVLAYGATPPPGGPIAPTIKSAGIDFEESLWWGLFGPPGMPNDLRDKLNAETIAALQDPAFAKLLESSGATASRFDPAEFAKAVKKEVTEVNDVVKAAKIVFE